MTDQTSIQAKIWRGYAIAAQKIGLSYAHYRPLTALNAISVPNLLAALPASFSPDGTYKKPSGYAKPTWLCLADGSQLQVGDYLVGGSTYFIAGMQPLLPIFAVACNRTLTVTRQAANDFVGSGGYGGNTLATETVVMSGWPASVLQGTKGEKNDVNLPGDVRNPWWAILMPAFEGAEIETSDFLTDDLNRRYVVSSAERTDLGWRITAQQAQS
jgi:hypothetical protein